MQSIYNASPETYNDIIVYITFTCMAIVTLMALLVYLVIKKKRRLEREALNRKIIEKSSLVLKELMLQKKKSREQSEIESKLG
mmetsp:Transcript_20531/g.15137  ORF Transcript_20531/g.15137 Transcript_20531/m.15137 type:complete len:83 (+) Transcript_20531:75-323(+)